jgi:protein tyrosine phosphatase (PTP) superfamily phosphohydrolase (DUF442 family)
VLVAGVTLMLVGNLAILAASALAQWRSPAPPTPVTVVGVGNVAMVDAKVWRGGRPGVDGHRSLAAGGVTTVVDLRAEDDAGADDVAIAALGLQVVHLPIRDGQVPSAAQVAEFLGIVAAARGTVFVHCGAGVGRTGSMAAAYLIQTGQAGRKEALGRNLAVGPPSLEQLTYVAMMGRGETDSPPAALVGLSRVLDAPRRLLSYL